MYSIKKSYTNIEDIPHFHCEKSQSERSLALQPLPKLPIQLLPLFPTCWGRSFTGGFTGLDNYSPFPSSAHSSRTSTAREPQIN